MPLDSFFHEMAVREASAGRDFGKGKPPLWWRVKMFFTPKAVRVTLTIVLVVLSALGSVFRRPLGEYLRGRTPHWPGAADSLATVMKRTTPIERLHREAVAYARENNPLGCQRAIERGLKLADVKVVLSWLQNPEVRRLRVNEFFDEFILRLESRRQAAELDHPNPLRIRDVR